MKAIMELEDLISSQVKVSGNKLKDIGTYQLRDIVVEKLMYGYENSLEYNGRKGSFYDFSPILIELLLGMKYITPESPLGKWEGDSEMCEFTEEAKSMYQRLKEEGYYKKSSVIKIPIFNSPGYREPLPIDTHDCFEPKEDGL